MTSPRLPADVDVARRPRAKVHQQNSALGSKAKPLGANPVKAGLCKYPEDYNTQVHPSIIRAILLLIFLLIIMDSGRTCIVLVGGSRLSPAAQHQQGREPRMEDDHPKTSSRAVVVSGRCGSEGSPIERGTSRWNVGSEGPDLPKEI